MSVNWGGNDRGPVLLGVTWAFTGLTFGVVEFRIFGRTAFGANHLGLDDFFTVFCEMIQIASAATITLAVKYGVGKHIEDVAPQDLGQAIRMGIIANSIVIWAFSMPKFAIIALLRRLLRLSKRTEWTVWTIAIVNQLGILTTSVLWFERCHPQSKAWDPTVDGTCDTFFALGISGYVIASVSTFLDLFFTLYPILFGMTLNMSLRKRIGICASLSLCAVGCIVSIVKIVEVPATVQTLISDPAYAIVPITLFANVESNLLLLGASLATLGPVVRCVRGKPTAISLPNRFKPTGSSSKKDAWRSNKGYTLSEDAFVQAGTQRGFQDTTQLVTLPEIRAFRGTDEASQSPAYGGINRSVSIEVSYS